MNISVMQWNIGILLFGLRKKGKQIFPYSLLHKNRVSYIKEQITTQSSDILFLQEYIVDEIRLVEYPYQVVMDRRFFPTKSVILSKIPFDAVYQDTENGFLAVQIKNTWFICVHLYSGSPRIRAQQAGNLLKFIKSKKVVIMGDFNMVKIGNKFLFKKDKQSFEMLYNNFDYVRKPKFGSYVFPVELDYLFSSGADISSATTRSDPMMFLKYGMDHYWTTCDVDSD